MDKGKKKRKRRYLILLLAVLLAVSALIIYVCIDKSNNPFIVQLSDGGMVITGYHGFSREIDIPDEIDSVYVIAIGDKAFADNKRITSISMPDSVTSIGEGVFSNCSSLEQIKLSLNIEEICNNTFFKLQKP